MKVTTRSIGTNYEPDPEPEPDCTCNCESIEVAARIQFIRSLALLCKNHGVEWTIVGGFLRRMLSGARITGSNLDILISSPSHAAANHHNMMISHALEFNSRVQAVFLDLEVLGVISGPFIKLPERPYSWTCEAVMYFETRFEVIVDAFPAGINNTFSPLFSSDNLSLTPAALELSALPLSQTNVDRVNTCPGISLLDRLAELRCGNVRMTARYYNQEEYIDRETGENFPDNPYLRRQNAHLMLREHSLFQQGLNVVGALQRAPPSACPVCLEAKEDLVELECRHAFCIPCLAGHISGNGDARGRCPLCRRRVQLVYDVV
jgi:hypothetical protein